MSAQTSSYYTLPFLFVLFANFCTVHGSIGEITYSRLLSADKASVISFLVIYSALYWTPIMFTVYMVHTRSTLYGDERAFDKKWCRWSNQYAFHEVMFRTQLMMIVSLIVIFSFEPGWPFFTATSIIGMVFSMSFMSKCVSFFLVEPRILSKDEKKYFYQLDLDEESEQRQSMQQNSECPQMKRQRSRIIKSRHHSIFQQFSWKKQQKKTTVKPKPSRNIMSAIRLENSNRFELRTPLLSDSSSSSALELSTFTNHIN